MVTYTHFKKGLALLHEGSHFIPCDGPEAFPLSEDFEIETPVCRWCTQPLSEDGYSSCSYSDSWTDVEDWSDFDEAEMLCITCGCKVAESKSVKAHAPSVKFCDCGRAWKEIVDLSDDTIKNEIDHSISDKSLFSIFFDMEEDSPSPSL
jgi:hypothetical protein